MLICGYSSSPKTTDVENLSTEIVASDISNEIPEDQDLFRSWEDCGDDFRVTEMEDKCLAYEEDFFYTLCESFISAGYKRSTEKTRRRPNRYIKSYQKKKLEVKQELITDNSRRKSSSRSFSCSTSSPNFSQTDSGNNRRTAPPSSNSHVQELQTTISRPSSQTHESGLTYGQLMELCNRELTPEDYEMLLRLDETVQKKTLEDDAINRLEEKLIEQKTEELCSVCMCEFEIGDKVKKLPCTHEFHADCIRPWFANHSQSCPMCKSIVV